MTGCLECASYRERLEDPLHSWETSTQIHRSGNNVNPQTGDNFMMGFGSPVQAVNIAFKACPKRRADCC